MSKFDKKLAGILAKYGVVGEEQRETILAAAAEGKKSLTEYLIEQKLSTEAGIIGAIAWDVYGNSVAEINAAESGSSLLGDQGTVNTFKAWLEPFKFVGLATILVGISLAVHTILQVIRFQGQRIRELAAGS